jgi:hypothetical protein
MSMLRGVLHIHCKSELFWSNAFQPPLGWEFFLALFVPMTKKSSLIGPAVAETLIPLPITLFEIDAETETS